ncbi:iron ABC transporter permease [Parvibaculaceae bacterium PLY_AMNH_Bact1]|nr:iron ABC transporter permease [Parvibaculaceae bacterium PLY_AMNH_Bact1]
MSALDVRDRERIDLSEVMRSLALPGLALLLAAAALTGLTRGAAEISAGDVLGILWSFLWGPEGVDPVSYAIVLEIRMPRVLLGGMVGATLAVSGAVLQALFRNPLAEPSIIGVSAGAGAAAVTMIVLGAAFGAMSAILLYALPVAAFAGGFVATMIVVAVARVNGQTPMTTILLSGIAVAALGSAIMGLMMFISNDEQLRSITFWMLGSLGGATWATILPAVAIMSVILLAMPVLMYKLNLMLLGEREAASLGLNVDRFKYLCVALVAAGVGAAVAVSGTIGFVGIVVPHLLRMVVGPDHRILLPASALGGAALLLWADVVARTLAPPAELPIGVLTALLGAPFFLWLLRRAAREGTSW